MSFSQILESFSEEAGRNLDQEMLADLARKYGTEWDMDIRDYDNLGQTEIYRTAAQILWDYNRITYKSKRKILQQINLLWATVKPNNNIKSDARYKIKNLFLTILKEHPGEYKNLPSVRAFIEAVSADPAEEDL